MAKIVQQLNINNAANNIFYVKLWWSNGDLSREWSQTSFEYVGIWASLFFVLVESVLMVPLLHVLTYLSSDMNAFK